MTKQLRKVLSILCMVTMLFSNLSLNNLFGPSGQTAAAEAFPVDPMNRVDDTMGVGETKEGVIPLTRPKFTRQIGSLMLLVQG